jgi:hypothetical protein
VKFTETPVRHDDPWPTYGGLPRLELTRRNLQSLLEKLDDPKSARTLVDPENKIIVTAVEDEEHYRDRAPGTVYMPTTGEYR